MGHGETQRPYPVPLAGPSSRPALPLSSLLTGSQGVAVSALHGGGKILPLNRANMFLVGWFIYFFGAGWFSKKCFGCLVAPSSLEAGPSSLSGVQVPVVPCTVQGPQDLGLEQDLESQPLGGEGGNKQGFPIPKVVFFGARVPFWGDMGLLSGPNMALCVSAALGHHVLCLSSWPA